MSVLKSISIIASIISGSLLIYLGINYNSSDKTSILKYLESQGITRTELKDKTWKRRI